MELIEWDESLEVGIDVVDSQHRGLVELLNRVLSLHTIIDADERKMNTEDILSDLFSYTEFHFKTEEEYMEAMNYPDLENHKKIHLHLVSKLLQLNEDLCGAGTDVFVEAEERLFTLLTKWLVEHIQKEDFKFKPFVKNLKK